MDTLIYVAHATDATQLRASWPAPTTHHGPGGVQHALTCRIETLRGDDIPSAGRRSHGIKPATSPTRTAPGTPPARSGWVTVRFADGRSRTFWAQERPGEPGTYSLT